jgi:hypothetical protein
MNKLYPSLLLGGLFVLIFIACGKPEADKYHNNPTVKRVDSTPLLTLSSSWKKVTTLMSGFPTGIQVYLSKAPVNGKQTVAYITVFDLKAGLKLKPVLARVNKKLTDLYNESSGVKYAGINGGFFGTNVSYSLSMYNGVIDAINIKSLNRSYSGSNVPYYPTRAALGITENGMPDVTWIYHVGAGNGIVFAYPQPANNQLNSAPLVVPSATFPAGGVVWNVKTAIGGSPMLIKDNIINISDGEELIVIDNNSSRARSAIGYTADQKIVMLAVEGNNVTGGAGFTLAELAQMMKDLGCIGAINLDGGGSTSMVVNGLPTIKPSDGPERGVMTALLVVK